MICRQPRSVLGRFTIFPFYLFLRGCQGLALLFWAWLEYATIRVVVFPPLRILGCRFVHFNSMVIVPDELKGKGLGLIVALGMSLQARALVNRNTQYYCYHHYP